MTSKEKLLEIKKKTKLTWREIAEKVHTELDTLNHWKTRNPNTPTRHAQIFIDRLYKKTMK